VGNIADFVRKINSHRVSRRFNREYQEISRLSDRDSLTAFITAKRNALYLHAYYHTRYYHHIFDEIGLISHGRVDQAKIADIPILTKDIIRRNFPDLVSDDYQTRKWYYNSSGGSTGEPIRLIQDSTYEKWGNATNLYYFRNILRIDEQTAKKIVLWGSERDLFEGNPGIKATIDNWFSNTIFLNSFRMTEQDIETYIQRINESKPKIVRGYAGSLYEVCKYAQKKKIRLHAPEIVVSAAENLSDTMRSVIESNFGTKVFDYYGSREASNLAGQCHQGLLHPFSFWNYLEVLDSANHPVAEGGVGRVIVTNLHNFSMPLIRYEIGDMAIAGPENCSCGSFLPALKKVTGRITSPFIRKNGTTVPAEFFIHLLGVVCFEEGKFEKFQVIQEDYEKIRIKLVTHNELSDKYRNEVDEKIRFVMGPECIIIWEPVAEIPKTPSGKYVYTISQVKM
jgi:phenylacetate-CoA ligase